MIGFLVFLFHNILQQARSTDYEVFGNGDHHVNPFVGLITGMILAGEVNTTAFFLTVDGYPVVSTSVLGKGKTARPRRPDGFGRISSIFYPDLLFAGQKGFVGCDIDLIIPLQEFDRFIIDFHLCYGQQMDEVQQDRIRGC